MPSLSNLDLNDQVFLDVSVNEKYYGRITFELFSQELPKTCANFKALCTGECGISKISGKPLTYKGSHFHRVFTDYVIQGGDFTRGDGFGGESIYPENFFEDECFQYMHTGPGLLSMANCHRPNSNTSQFFISIDAKPLSEFNGKYVVFGKVKSGAETLLALNKLGNTFDGIPTAKLTITDCGI